MKTTLKCIAKTAWQCISTTRVYARSKTTFSKLGWGKLLCAFFERAWLPIRRGPETPNGSDQSHSDVRALQKL